MKKSRTHEEKLECLKKVLINSLEHKRSNDPVRIYTQYIRYALEQFKNINFYESENAKAPKGKGIIHEHIIPFVVVRDKLLALHPLTIENIKSVIDKYYFTCAVTTEEDDQLTANNLKSKMPKGWIEDKDSVFARYEEVGIRFTRKIKSIRQNSNNKARQPPQ
jgi:hypothetical protein